MTAVIDLKHAGLEESLAANGEPFVRWIAPFILGDDGAQIAEETRGIVTLNEERGKILIQIAWEIEKVLGVRHCSIELMLLVREVQ